MTADDDESFKEKYLRLRQEHTSLQTKCNDQDAVIRRMNTKLSQIESQIKTKHKIDLTTSGGGLGSPDGRRPPARNRENEDLITELYRVNAELHKKNLALENKNRALVQSLEKRKRELDHARRTLALSRGASRSSSAPGGPRPRSPPPRAAAAGGARRSASPPPRQPGGGGDMRDELETLSARKLAELVERLRVRLVNYESQLNVVREENVRLREAKLKTDKCGPTDAAEQAVAYSMTGRKARVGMEGGEEVTRLDRELRDTQARLQLMQTRYDHLEAKTRAQSEIQQGSIDQLEEYNERIRDLRRALQEAQREKDELELQASQLPDLEEKNRELKTLNEHLEQQITKLCESPFISEAFQKQERANRLGELERNDRAQKLKIQHLEDQTQAQHAQLLALQKASSELREDKVEMERELQELRVRFRQTEAGAQLLNDKMKLYGGSDDDIDIQELERALTLVRRRAEAHGHGGGLDFLERTGTGGLGAEDEETVPGLKRKVQVLQVTNLNLTRELERCERMLKAQSAITKDLHLEIEDMTRRSTADRKDLQDRLEGFEALALKRLQRLHYLEAQIKQYRYNIHKPLANAMKLPGLDHLVPGGDGGGEASEAALLDEVAAGDFGPDENLLEVWVVSAEISPGVLELGCSSFLLLDFFDYESQATPFVLGNHPKYDFATTYKVTVDDFLLSHLATECLVIELNRTRHLDYDMIARTKVPLVKLLENRPALVLPKQPLVSVKDASVVGTVHVELRLALPVVEVYKLFLQRHPEERARIDKLLSEQMKGSSSLLSKYVEDSVRLQNEIEVTVVQLTGLPKRPGSSLAPCPYVHYQVLGFQDICTPVADQGTDANVAHSSSFSVTSDAKLLRFLRRYRVTFSVIDFLDDDDDEEESKRGGGGGGLIGKVEVSLSPLSDGEAVLDTFEVADEQGKKAGKIRLSVKWKYPLKTGRHTGPNALLGVEVAELLAKFSPNKDGLVRYRDFIRYCDPPSNVREALRKMRDFLTRADQTQGLDTRSVLDHLSGSSSSNGGADLTGVDEDAFHQGLLPLNTGLAPDEVADLFAYLDTRQTGHVSLDTMVAYLTPPTNTLAGVMDKVHDRFRDLSSSRGLLPLPAFEQVDEDKTGKVTRMQFKEALLDLGFVLVDEPLLAPSSSASGIVGAEKGRGAGSMTEEEEAGGVMRPGREWVWEGGKGPSGSSKGGRAACLQQKREEFEKRIKALEEAKSKLQEEGQAVASEEGKEGEEEEEGRLTMTQLLAQAGLDMGNSTSASGAAVQQQAVIKDTGARVYRYGPEEAATRVQARYRGYVTRKQQRGGAYSNTTAAFDGEDGVGGGSSSYLLLDNGPAAVPPIVAAEDALVRCVRETHGISAPPDLRPTFMALDRQGKGTVNRKQFAHALRQHPSLHGLGPQHLRSLMDFFDTSASADGTGIDYRAFLIFGEYRAPEVHPGVAAMRKMMLHSGSLEIFRRFDPEGLGLIPPADFLEGLRELGYGYLGASVLRMLPTLFDYREVRTAQGLSLTGVDYQNFVDVALEQEGSRRLREVETKLRAMIHHQQQQEEGGAVVVGLREAFARLDVTDSGAVTQVQFGQALVDMGLVLSEDELRVLYGRVDAKQSGMVHYHDFVLFMDAPPSPRPLHQHHSSGGDFDEAGLQAKGCNLLLDAANRGVNVSGVGKAFAHYDWRRHGRLPASLFLRAAMRAGLTYTLHELHQIARHFSVGAPVGPDFSVNYRRFLAWVMGESQPQEAAGGDNGIIMRRQGEEEQAAVVEGGVDVAGIVAKLKEARKRWIRDAVDYRHVMERYDDDLKGTLSRSDFSKAIRELVGAGSSKASSPRRHRQEEEDEGLVLPLIDDDEISRLCQRFNQSGRVAYLEFLHTLRPSSSEGGGSWEVEEDLRWMIRRRFQYYTAGKLKEPFRHFSLGKKHYFSEADFSDGMRALGFRLPSEEERLLFAKLDLDCRGKVSAPAFVTWVRDPNYADVEAKLTKRIKKLKVGAKEVGKALTREEQRQQHEEDEEDEGAGRQQQQLGRVVSYRGFRRALDRLGLDMQAKDCDRIAARYDARDDRHVSVELFLAYVKDLEEPRDSDDDSEEEDRHGLTPAQVDKVIKRLAKIIKAGDDKGLKPECAFEHFDRTGAGVVDEEEFLEGMDRLHIMLTPQECKQVLKKLGASRGGKKGGSSGGGLLLDYDHFAKGLGLEVAGGGTQKGDGSSSQPGASSGGGREWEGVVEELGRQVKRKPRATKHLKEQLEQMDKKHKGSVSREDLRFALEQADLDLAPRQLRLLMDILAAAKGGREDGSRVEYGRLLAALIPALDPVVAKVRSQCGGIKDAEKRLRALLGDYDRRESGRVARRELRICLEELGVDLSNDEVKALTKRFEVADDASMTDTSAFMAAVFSSSSDGEGSKRGGADPVEAVLCKIRGALRKEGRKVTSLRPKLERADERAKGYVSAKAFNRVLDEFELDLDRKETATLQAAFLLERGGDGATTSYVCYMDLCDRLEQAAEGEEGGGDGSSSKVAVDTMDYLMDLLRRAGEKGIDLLECFEHFDSNGDGSIDEDEFRQGLKKLDVRLSKAQAKEVMQRFAGRRKGLILYKEFVMAVRKSGGDDDDNNNTTKKKKTTTKQQRDEEDEEGGVKLSRTLTMVLVSQLPPSSQKLKRALQEVDKGGNGRVSRRDFRTVMEEDLKIDLQESEWKQLLAQLDSADKGYIKYQDFLAWAEQQQRQEEEGGGGRKGRARDDDDDEGKGSSYEGKRKAGLRADEAVEVTVGRLKLTDRQAIKEWKGSEVSVAYRFLEEGDHTHQSRYEELGVDGEADVGYVRTFPCPRGSHLRDALAQAAGGSSKGAGGTVTFTILAKSKGHRAEEVGSAKLDLVSCLLEERRDLVQHAVRVEDDKGDKLGSLTITVKGYEAVEEAAASNSRGSNNKR